jgi:hypothetical protein
MTSTEYNKARMRAYYIANRENILAYNKAYRKAHPEKWAAYRAAISTEKKLKRSEYNRNYYAKNREKLRAYHRAWIAARPGYYKRYKRPKQCKNVKDQND